VQDAGVADLVFTRDDRGFSALDASTGAVRWSSPTPDFVNAATRDSVVVVRDDRITALATADGKPRWSRPKSDFLRSSSFDELGIDARGRHVIVAVHPPSN
jgi:outer membrane protein assembly factor BamB